MTTPEDRPGPKAEYFARIAGHDSAGAREAKKAEAAKMARERLGLSTRPHSRRTVVNGADEAGRLVRITIEEID